MTKPVLHKIRRKRKAWIKYKITQADSDYLALMLNAEMRLYHARQQKESKRCLEKEIAECISNNPKRFWKYDNSKVKVMSMLSEPQQSDGSLQL